MELDLKQLGQNIRFLRLGRGWSLADLAEHSKVSKAYLSDLENGSGGRPNIQYLYQIAMALGTTIERLISGSPESSTPTEEAMTGELPPGLQDFAREQALEAGEIEMLAKLHFRGNRPRDAEAWRAIYQVIKAVSNR